jgi:hypothetical protein
MLNWIGAYIYMYVKKCGVDHHDDIPNTNTIDTPDISSRNGRKLKS